MLEEMETDKGLAISLIERYMNLQRILCAEDKEREIHNQLITVKAQLEVCGVNIEKLKIQ
jgi:hypothetical protein|uniref:hypothetical protein n=1 Tax=Eubacterium cellulosolvens TaxID=29322 RepID=UPI00048917C8|nr:hypothetical protein [[Eubacterium] cellulosolvens]